VATLTAKVTESITLASGTVDSTNTLTISNISDVSKRVVTVAVAETGIVGFATAGSTNLSKSYVAGQFDEDEALYLRITNLDSTYHCTLTFKNENDDEFCVLLDKGQSFIYNGDLAGGMKNTMDGIAGGGITVSLGDLVDVTAIADTQPIQLEVFVASEASAG
tara:strand:- start:48 stop:536 length:489 start_codon:yes stop_codon:yes gene_type:complete